MIWRSLEAKLRLKLRSCNKSGRIVGLLESRFHLSLSLIFKEETERSVALERSAQSVFPFFFSLFFSSYAVRKRRVVVIQHPTSSSVSSSTSPWASRAWTQHGRRREQRWRGFGRFRARGPFLSHSRDGSERERGTFIEESSSGARFSFFPFLVFYFYFYSRKPFCVAFKHPL